MCTNGRQGVNYRRGVWHHSLIALNAPARFIVIDRGGPGDNCDVLPIGGAEGVVLDLDSAPESDTSQAVFKETMRELFETLTPEYIQRLQARAVHLIPVIRKNAQTFSEAAVTPETSDSLGRRTLSR